MVRRIQRTTMRVLVFVLVFAASFALGEGICKEKAFASSYQPGPQKIIIEKK